MFEHRQKEHLSDWFQEGEKKVRIVWKCTFLLQGYYWNSFLRFGETPVQSRLQVLHCSRGVPVPMNVYYMCVHMNIYTVCCWKCVCVCVWIFNVCTQAFGWYDSICVSVWSLLNTFLKLITTWRLVVVAFITSDLIITKKIDMNKSEYICTLTL